MRKEVLISLLLEELAQIRVLVKQVELLLELIRQTENHELRSGLVSGLALHLHSFYTGAERIFYDIARDIDGEVPTSSNWHQQLLEQMNVEIPSVRPPVLSEQTRFELDEFRKFRHVVRSRYAYQLDPQRVQALAAKLPVVSIHLIQECQQFCSQSKQSEQEPEQFSSDEGIWS